MAAGGDRERRKQNDSGFIELDDPEVPLERSTSSETDCHTSVPVTEQENQLKSIAVSKNGPICPSGLVEPNVSCQSESEVIINKQAFITAEVIPIDAKQTSALEVREVQQPEQEHLDKEVKLGLPEQEHQDKEVQQGLPEQEHLDKEVQQGLPEQEHLDKEVRQGLPEQEHLDKEVQQGLPEQEHLDKEVWQGLLLDKEVQQGPVHIPEVDKEVQQGIDEVDHPCKGAVEQQLMKEIRLLELTREKEEMEHRMKMRKMEMEIEEKQMKKRLLQVEQELRQMQCGPATFRYVNPDIEPGPTPSLDGSPHSVPARLGDEDHSLHAQETGEANSHGVHGSELKCSPVEEVTPHNVAKDSMVTGQEESSTDSSEDQHLDNTSPPPDPDLDGKGVQIAMPGIPPMFPSQCDIKVWHHSADTERWRNTFEVILQMLSSAMSPGAKYIFYPGNDATSTAAVISCMTDEWIGRADTVSQHSFIICILCGWKYNRALEAAINRANSEGIIIVCAAKYDREDTERMLCPGALGSVLCIAESPNGSTALSSARGGAIDHVEPGVLKHQKYDLTHGTPISAARFAGNLALILEVVFKATGVSIKGIAILKEFLLFETNCYGRVNFKSLSRRPALQIKKDLEHISQGRNRKQYDPVISCGDAKANTKLWSGLHNDPKQLCGAGVTIAMIDNIEEGYLMHVQNHHKIKIKCEGQIQYFYMYAKDVMQECCRIHRNGAQGHVLQCAAIVANCVPKCRLLLIRHQNSNRVEEGALKVVEKEKPEVLLVSAVTSDTHDSFCTNLGSILSWCIVVCAAGNEGKTDRNTICYPARMGNLIVIGACDQFGNRRPYSSVGRELNFLCPGEFDIADATGKGGTCYAASAGASFIAKVLQLITTKCGGRRIRTEIGRDPIPISELACNTYLMRSLLSHPSMGLCSRADHSPTEGHGMLLIDKISLLTPEVLEKFIVAFYK